VYADYSYRAKAIELMLEYYGQQNAFRPANGKTHKVNYIIKDDGVDPVRTVPLTDELIDSEKVFAQITLGSVNAFKVYDELNARCIPHPLIMSGHPAWGDPVHHPWTTGLQLAYNTESVMWGAFIDQHIGEFSPGKAKIAALYLNNDYGKVAAAEQNGMHQSAKYLFMPNLCVASSLVGKEAVGGDAPPRTAGGW
jgi:hypothetical protein